MLTMKDQVASIQQDLLRLRVAVMPDLPPEEAQSIYHPTQFDDLIDFRAFCSKLAADPEFRLLVVSNSLVRFCALVQLHIRFFQKRYHVLRTATSGIGSTLRNIVRCHMSDKLCAGHNITGTHGADKLPPAFYDLIQCKFFFYSSYFYLITCHRRKLACIQNPCFGISFS
jgi:hypothetical protein